MTEGIIKYNKLFLLAIPSILPTSDISNLNTGMNENLPINTQKQKLIKVFKLPS